jgi:hypothetical protein
MLSTVVMIVPVDARGAAQDTTSLMVVAEFCRVNPVTVNAGLSLSNATALVVSTDVRDAYGSAHEDTYPTETFARAEVGGHGAPLVVLSAKGVEGA